jgi:hypothetical protein
LPFKDVQGAGAIVLDSLSESQETQGFEG